MKKFKFLVCLIATLACLCANALSVKEGDIKDKKIFGILFPDGTSFFANSNCIVSISKQEYLMNSLLITEMSIDLLGTNTQLRIYSGRPIDSKTLSEISSAVNSDKLKKANTILDKGNFLNSAVQDVKIPKIRKDYPATTHSHTLEFICPDHSELETFYKRFTSDYILSKFSESKPSEKAEDLTNPGIAGKIYILELKKEKPSNPLLR